MSASVSVCSSVSVQVCLCQCVCFVSFSFTFAVVEYTVSLTLNELCVPLSLVFHLLGKEQSLKSPERQFSFATER